MRSQNIRRICLAIFCFFLMSGICSKQVQASEAVSIETILLQDINAIRASYGLSALSLDGTLTYDAQVRAGEITSYFSHTRPDGTPWYYVDYYRMYGETLAMGYSCTENGAHNIVSLWMNSPAHAALLLESGFRTVGFAACQDSDGNWYWTAELGY